MQFWFIFNVGNLCYFFQDLINKKKKNLYITFLTIAVEKLEVSIFYFFWKILDFIQQRFAKLIETVIVKIDIARKHLYFE